MKIKIVITGPILICLASCVALSEFKETDDLPYGGGGTSFISNGMLQDPLKADMREILLSLPFYEGTRDSMAELIVTNKIRPLKNNTELRVVLGGAISYIILTKLPEKEELTIRAEICYESDNGEESVLYTVAYHNNTWVVEQVVKI